MPTLNKLTPNVPIVDPATGQPTQMFLRVLQPLLSIVQGIVSAQAAAAAAQGGSAELNLGNGTRILSGNGQPAGSVAGSVGDLYSQTDGAAGSVLWVKTSGEATNTGWTAVA